MSDGPLAALREATAERHERLDAGLDLVRIERVESYRDLLARLLGVVEPLEAALDVAPLPVADWPARRRAHLLRDDLGGASVPHCPRVPDVDDPDRALGALYVLEGSTLGGRHVAEAVHRRFGPDVPTRWFRADGDDVPMRWRGFRRAVHARAEAGGDVAAMVAGASATFDAFLAWCVQPERVR